MPDKYSSFAELSQYEDDDDYEIVTATRDSDILVLSPHGGKIERRVSEIVQKVAGNDYNLYLFEGRKKNCNYDTLHITSSRFDEPTCREMLESARVVVAIHGCQGEDKAVYLGGLDETFRDRFTDALREEGYNAQAENHDYPGTHCRNICNLGTEKAGVQIEMTLGLRLDLDIEAFAAVLRDVIETA